MVNIPPRLLLKLISPAQYTKYKEESHLRHTVRPSSLSSTRKHDSLRQKHAICYSRLLYSGARKEPYCNKCQNDGHFKDKLSPSLTLLIELN